MPTYIRMSLGHCELNPTQLVLAQVKRHALDDIVKQMAFELGPCMTTPKVATKEIGKAPASDLETITRHVLSN